MLIMRTGAPVAWASATTPGTNLPLPPRKGTSTARGCSSASGGGSQQIVTTSPTLSDELQTIALNIEDPGRLVDFIASSLPFLATTDKQELLETPDVMLRMERINKHLAKEAEVTWEYRLLPGRDGDAIIEAVKRRAAEQVLPKYRARAAEAALHTTLHAQYPGLAMDEESPAIVLAKQLTGRRWRDNHGAERSVEPADILIVTPYNAQIRTIERALAASGLTGFRVGTVDKFQGQEAPAVIYSMATSSADEAPRGLDFLYDPHRLNVATSRARALAIIVASPDLIRVSCRTPHQMVLANALCQAWETGG